MSPHSAAATTAPKTELATSTRSWLPWRPVSSARPKGHTRAPGPKAALCATSQARSNYTA